MSLDRRKFITVSAASLSGALLAACDANPKSAGRLLALAEARNETVERGLFRHAAVDRVPGSAKLAGKDFPKYFISDTVPTWNPAARGVWRLEVSGAVRTPLSLTLDDLIKLPRITQKVDHFCVEGWNARAVWSGVRVSDLARLAGATNDAHYVDFTSFDSDYHESWDMASAMHAQTLVAYGMDGTLLGPAHGAPARVHSPVKLGYKNTKYLTKVIFMPAKNGGYWSDLGYEWYGGT
ncbi:MAG: oxidoreductase molybdopterin binding protein [Gemmatimonadetes bacterium]|nr:oxidoreductase molybdopterin binding protein [Gemmatimonadota bacterium]